jgi:hypothetical protein
MRMKEGENPTTKITRTYMLTRRQTMAQIAERIAKLAAKHNIKLADERVSRMKYSAYAQHDIFLLTNHIL